jgi:hypothetical protein
VKKSPSPSKIPEETGFEFEGNSAQGGLNQVQQPPEQKLPFSKANDPMKNYSMNMGFSVSSPKNEPPKVGSSFQQPKEVAGMGKTNGRLGGPQEYTNDDLLDMMPEPYRSNLLALKMKSKGVNKTTF